MIHPPQYASILIVKVKVVISLCIAEGWDGRKRANLCLSEDIQLTIVVTLSAIIIGYSGFSSNYLQIAFITGN